MRTLFNALRLAALTLLISGNAEAVTVTGGILTDFSAPGLISFEANQNPGGTTVAFVDLEGDTGPLTFNAIFNRTAGGPWSFLDIVLTAGNGMVFSVVGDVTDGTPTTFPLFLSSSTSVKFDLQNTLSGAEIGDPLSATGAVNFEIDVSGLASETFSIFITPTVVPEPGTALLFSLGLVGLAIQYKRTA